MSRVMKIIRKCKLSYIGVKKLFILAFLFSIVPSLIAWSIWFSEEDRCSKYKAILLKYILENNLRVLKNPDIVYLYISLFRKKKDISSIEIFDVYSSHFKNLVRISIYDWPSGFLIKEISLTKFIRNKSLSKKELKWFKILYNSTTEKYLDRIRAFNIPLYITPPPYEKSYFVKIIIDPPNNRVIAIAFKLPEVGDFLINSILRKKPLTEVAIKMDDIITFKTDNFKSPDKEVLIRVKNSPPYSVLVDFNICLILFLGLLVPYGMGLLILKTVFKKFL